MDELSHNLVRRAQSRDPEALDALFERYRERLRSALRKMLGDRYRAAALDSEDAVQDALLSASKRLDEFEYRGSGSFLAWLLQSAKFEMQNRVRGASTAKRDVGRARGLETHDDPRDDRATPSEVASGHELEDRVQELLGQLAPAERDVIVLKRYVGMETSEIREELGMSTEGAVRALLSRAQLRLAQLLDRE